MKKALIFFIFLFFFFFSLLFTRMALATLGVGVGIGKIQVDQKLNPGQIYNLPPITVLNTGTEPSDYRVLIEYQQNQLQLAPQTSWFTFSPQTFHLDPHKAQSVNVVLSLPIKTAPGNYFAYLEAQPVRKTINGITAVNIAAATKLYFTVVPGSIIAGIYFKALSLWTALSPLPQIVVGILFVCLFIVLAKRFINVEIKLTKHHIPRWVIIVSVAIFFILYSLLWIKIFQALKH